MKTGVSLRYFVSLCRYFYTCTPSKLKTKKSLKVLPKDLIITPYADLGKLLILPINRFLKICFLQLKTQNSLKTLPQDLIITPYAEGENLLIPTNSMFLKICFFQQQNGVEETMISLSEFNKKIWRWNVALGYLYFLWSAIFSNVMVLHFREWYVSFSMILVLLSFLCKDATLILKLDQKK